MKRTGVCGRLLHAMKARTTFFACLLLPCLPATGAGGAEPFHPDDPLFFPDVEERHDGQWHLRETGFPAAWESGATGRGVVIGIVDNEFGPPHPEVESWRVRALERDFRDGDEDPAASLPRVTG